MHAMDTAVYQNFEGNCRYGIQLTVAHHASCILQRSQKANGRGSHLQVFTALTESESKKPIERMRTAVTKIELQVFRAGS